MNSSYGNANRINKKSGYIRSGIRSAAVVLIAVICMSVIGFPLFADQTKNGITYATDLEVTLTTVKEVKTALMETITIPFMRGSSPLTSGNAIRLTPSFQLTPISLNGSFEAVWTPIAFFQIVTGGTIGTGWNIPIANGLCINSRSSETESHDSVLSNAAFDGIVWSAKAGGIFQFDLAAVLPGEWNHVVFRTYHVAWYRAFTGAADDESWLYEVDSGENRNGWNYYGNYFLGYQMPCFVDRAGFLVEEDLYLYTTPDRTDWGDDLGRWKFAALADFKVSDNVSTTLLVQFWTVRNFEGSTGDYKFYQDRVIDRDNPYRIEFYRAVASVTVRL